MNYRRRVRKDLTRINEAITAPEIRVISDEGGQIGVMPPARALELAREAGLDLVEISKGTNPPVCKIMDYGKYRYQQEKKKKEAKKKQHIIEVKEIRMTVGIGQHDMEFKIKKLRDFLKQGNKIKVSLRFKGRQIIFPEQGMKVMNKVLEELGDECVIEQYPKKEGRQMIMYLAPAK